MYICPACHRAYKNPEDVAKHSLGCWREHNPNHIAKPAPCKGNITEREVSEDVINFFTSFTICKK